MYLEGLVNLEDVESRLRAAIAVIPATNPLGNKLLTNIKDHSKYILEKVRKEHG
jgi:hypothetical protein